MEAKQLVVTEGVVFNGVSQESQELIKGNFQPFFDQIEQWSKKANELVITDISQTGEMKMARVARLELRKIRLAADKVRKELKEESLRYGKAVQGAYNIIEYKIKPIEEHLKKQEDFAQLQEEKRLLELRIERESQIEKYSEFAPTGIDYSLLTADEFKNLLNGAALQKKSKEDAEKAAERARIEAEKARIKKEKEDAVERERLRKENEALRLQQEKEREEARQERIKQEEKIKSERAAREKMEAEKRELQRKIDEEKKIEQRRIAEREKARQEEKQRIENEKEAEAKKGDADKVLDLISDLRALKTKYTFKSKSNQKRYTDVGLLIEKVVAHIAK